ncbi:MAG TPA: diguanylate cyclase [Steroidobacter sp.]|uniref:GGDEF domain-containing protein n=1 Tax=Steroidobacter sp. TaxID=1978227 RepID=UPI002EDA6E16
MELPATFQLELASSYLSIGVVTALAFMVIAALAGVLLLHARLSRRTRALATERARRLRAETELQSLRDDLESRVGERTHALRGRIEELGRVRLKLESANRRLKRLVAIDSLTGIANRRQFDRVLDREVRRARREQLPLSLIFLDLDDFKHFNDTFGHAHGDDVLRRVARILDESFRRGGDLVARYGGEEFAVVLPGVDAHRAGLYAERLRRRIWRMAIATGTSGAGDRITISAGVATVAPSLPGSVDATPETLLRAADQALYRAKCQGRNRVTTAGSSLTTAGQASAADDRPLVELAS